MNEELKNEVLALKKKLNATILVHNYVESDVQDIADFIGDSLELSRKAKENQAETIIFCGVRFMGETAKLLSPKARVIMPAANAGCPMAEMCQADALRAWKAANPEAYIVAYVNTTAATKALVDICVTSGNAERIVTKLDMDRPIMFLPDQNLGANLNRKLGINMMLWNGYCHTHNRISTDDIRQAKSLHPDSPVLVHLECKPAVVELADAALSTAGMLTYVQKSSAKSFIIGTEEGMIYRLETLFPDRQFYGLNHPILCPNMKRITLPLVRDALLGKGLEIQLPDEIMTRAVLPIERMLEMS
ncbi:MAG: quinolinate synthase NadA [Proteobacteria bacterium]|nr:quinolinate synthase NadA [Pseudomonadota bacterium]